MRPDQRLQIIHTSNCRRVGDASVGNRALEDGILHRNRIEKPRIFVSVHRLGTGRYLVPTGITLVIWASFALFSVI